MVRKASASESDAGGVGRGDRRAPARAACRAGRLEQGIVLTVGATLALPALCAPTFDLREGVTEMSRRIQSLHHMSLTVCVVVGIIVFGAMFYSIWAHRRSKRPEPAHFHENTRLEVVWTLIPTLILVGMAIPATTTLMEIEDNSDADLTVLVTGSQWKWHYQYVEADFGYYSQLATPRSADRQRRKRRASTICSRPIVLWCCRPNKKVRFLTTSRDVIHSWWVPDFAVKQDAVPGFINEAWTRVDKPGVYRGQCAELCGKDHAFMPIVVEVSPEAEFDRWFTGQRQALALASEAAVAARKKQWTMAELLPQGEEVYLEHCATCHQPNGLGQEGKYPALVRQPAS